MKKFWRWRVVWLQMWTSCHWAVHLKMVRMVNFCVMCLLPQFKINSLLLSYIPSVFTFSCLVNTFCKQNKNKIKHNKLWKIFKYTLQEKDTMTSMYLRLKWNNTHSPSSLMHILPMLLGLTEESHNFFLNASACIKLSLTIIQYLFVVLFLFEINLKCTISWVVTMDIFM